MATVPARAPLSRPQQRFFYLAGGIAAAVVVLAGFSRTYYLKSLFGTPELTTLVHVHGLLFTSWVVLFITQAWLISARRRDLHMRLGIAGFLLACTMIVVGTATAIESAKLGRPSGPPGPLIFMAVPLSAMLVFTILSAAGFYFRKRSDYHKRIMLIATLGLLNAAFGRIVIMLVGARQPLLAMGGTDLLVLTAVAYDTITRRKLHPAIAWSAAVVMLMQPLQFIVSRTSAWMIFAQWITR